MYAGEANLMTLLFMNVYHIYIYVVCFSSPLYWWVAKKGRKIWVHICMFICVYAYIYFMCIHMHIFMFLISKPLIAYSFHWHLSLHVLLASELHWIYYIHMFHNFDCISFFIVYWYLSFNWISICLYLFYVMHELRESFYEAYF